MSKNFNVLDRSLNLQKNYLLEASAGTGKTFSIQHLVVRLLLGNQHETIDKILVVTFTRAATRELKGRIRTNIEEALRLLNDPNERAPDYLRAIVECGGQAIHIAKKNLQNALYLFDQAQIFTIHSFCARMLKQFSIESDTSLHLSPTDKPFPRSELVSVIRDYFRTELRKGTFSPFQIEKYLRQDPDQLKLLRIIQSGYHLMPEQSFERLLNDFRQVMKELKSTLSLNSEKMKDDFRKQAVAYSNYGKETKIETEEKVARFSQLFDQEEWTDRDFDDLMADNLVWPKALDPNLLKKAAPNSSTLHYPTLTQQISEKLSPVVEGSADFSTILVRLASGCRQHLSYYQKEEEKHSADDLLKKMEEALKQPLFVKKIRERYGAVIIDEFQDTDPLQWNIFNQLFLPGDQSWKGTLTLVGDPKQSIYSFRQADIYTYLAAAQAIGEENCLSLCVNHRSQSHLVDALNLLFSKEHLPSFIPLPKQDRDLSYHPVSAAKASEQVDDQRGAIHFFIADCESIQKTSLQVLEESSFFPFIVSEILRLKEKRDFSYKQFAILVRDRNQASRLTEYLKRSEIPFANQRGTSLAQSETRECLIFLLQAIQHPRDRGKIGIALGTSLFGWTREDLLNPEWIEFSHLLMRRLKLSLDEKRFSRFIEDLFDSISKPAGLAVREELLTRVNGLEIYRDLQQLADCVDDQLNGSTNSPMEIIAFLDQFLEWEKNDDERANRFEDPSRDGVKILTLHMSKGLEFDIVFALGLVNRDERQDDLYPIDSVLTPVNKKCRAYQSYCEERDSEKMRQLYVALTRAKSQLYIPAIINHFSENLKFGEASPLDLFLARLHQLPATYETVYERIRNSSNSLIDFIEEIGKSHHITYSFLKDDSIVCHKKPPLDVSTALPIQSPPHVNVPGGRLWMTSFTSLSHQAEKLTAALPAPQAYICPLKNVHTLPAGAETGVLLHTILEKLSFSEFLAIDEPFQVIPLITPFIQNTPYREWGDVIAHLVFHTLKTKLSSFSLSELSVDNLYKEMSLLYPFKEQLIKGVMDLLFLHEGRYYLVDWKTNWLGPQADHYEVSFLHRAMQDNDYFLQGSIYTEAIKRYLKLVEPRPFSECFGGIFYLFLRGMQVGTPSGIYHFFPQEIEKLI